MNTSDLLREASRVLNEGPHVSPVLQEAGLLLRHFADEVELKAELKSLEYRLLPGAIVDGADFLRLSKEIYELVERIEALYRYADSEYWNWYGSPAYDWYYGLSGRSW